MMKCFLRCFASSKRTTRKHSTLAAIKGTPQTHVTEGVVEAAIEFARQKIAVDESIAEPRIKIEEQQSNSIAEVTSTKEEQIKSLEGIKEEQKKTEKKDIHEEEGEDVVNNKLPQQESSESLFSLSINSGKQISPAENPEIEVNSPIQLQNQFCTIKEEPFTSGSNPIDPEKIQHVSLENKEESLSLEEKEKAKHVHEYRYTDCYDEGYEDINLDDEIDLDVTFEEDDVKGTCVQEENCSESLFSLSTDSRKRISSAEKADDEVNSSTMVQEECSESLFSLSTDSRKRISSAEKVENEVNSPMPIQVSSRVLNPIESASQVTAVEATLLQPLTATNSNKSLISSANPSTLGKENIKLELHDVDIPNSPPEQSLKLSNRKERQRFKFNDENEGIRVDTSLSSWLVESETTPISKGSNNNNSVGQVTPKGRKGSAMSHEDRPILGALTLEEIKKYSVSASSKSNSCSRRRRSKSPDETPIIGTVGSYWSHTGRSMDSDLNTSGKDAKLKWSSTKLKTRLEGAFEASVGQV